jgi:hypothetical protein
MSDDNSKKIEKNRFVASEEDIKNIPKDDSIGTSGVFFEPPIEVVPEAPRTPVVKEGTNDLATDYQYMRTNLYAITERSIEALNNLAQIADQSQHPRAYEVVALLVNTIASAQKDLMTIHREKAKIEGIVAKSQPDVINNNLFVGNTAQLDEIIKKMTKGEDSDE